jgi:hypothetical protein
MSMDEMMDYESMKDPMLDRKAFFRRLRVHLSYSGMLVLLSLIVGTVGFKAFARCAWIDAFLNASMLLGGMGPIGTFDSTGAKLFAALYALYAGLVFLIVASFLFAPVFHRVLHRFHIEHDDGQ